MHPKFANAAHPRVIQGGQMRSISRGAQGKLELTDMHNVFTESPLLPCIPLHIWNSIHVKVLYGQFYN